MFDFPIEKYKFYVTKNKVIAVSTYKGKTVRGVAICSESDNFDLEKGKQLAAARCNYKVAMKRFANASERFELATDVLNQVNEQVGNAYSYYSDSRSKLSEAREALSNLESSL